MVERVGYHEQIDCARVSPVARGAGQPLAAEMHPWNLIRLVPA
jgi:hypothetical protein